MKDPVRFAEEIDASLRAVARPERAAGEKAYLKSDLEFYGASVPAIRSVVRDFHRDHTGFDRVVVLELATALWSAPVHERRMAAVEVLTIYSDLLEPDDLGFIERLLRESRTWALVDNLAAVVAGGLVERHPGLHAVVDRWAGDDDFWIRRASLLVHLLPLRRGDGDFDRFAGYADAMLDETEFFIRKAIGWVLREAGKQQPDLVYGWLAPRTHRASGVTMREAVKRLPPDRAGELLTAYREKRPVEPPGR